MIWRLSGASDATWGSCKEDGRSVTGCASHFMDAPVAWKSKAQGQVYLSSTESEHVGLSESIREVTP